MQYASICRDNWLCLAQSRIFTVQIFSTNIGDAVKLQLFSMSFADVITWDIMSMQHYAQSYIVRYIRYTEQAHPQSMGLQALCTLY